MYHTVNIDWVGQLYHTVNIDWEGQLHRTVNIDWEGQLTVLHITTVPSSQCRQCVRYWQIVSLLILW